MHSRGQDSTYLYARIYTEPMGSTEQSPSMPSKCPFCRRKYTRSGAYEKHLRTPNGVWTLFLHPPYNISTTWKLADCATHTPVSARIPTVNPIWAHLDQILTHFSETFHMSLILKYSIMLRLPLLASTFVMKGLEKLPEKSPSLSKHAATCVSTHGHYSIAPKV